MKNKNLILVMSVWVFICVLFVTTKNNDEKTHEIKTINSAKINFQIPPDTIHLERATTYQATIEQCDSTPFSTASGARINPDYYQKWVAISRDLHTRWGGEFDFGDTLEIYSKEHSNFNGQWVVQDIMAKRYTMSIDFLLEPEKNYPKLGVGTDVKIIMCSDKY